MSDVKKVLGRMGFYYLLLAINIIPCASVIPDVFPFRNSSTLYLLTLTVCLVLYYSHRVSPSGALSVAMKALSWGALLLILLRGMKYGVFPEVGAIARHIWYLYYVPMLLIPLFLFYISLLVSSGGTGGVPRIWYLAVTFTSLLTVLVLTNDLHQLAFRFMPGFEGWDSDYTRGWLFYVVTAWQYVLYFSAIAVLTVKCRVGASKKRVPVFLIPFAIGIAMSVLLMTGTMPKVNGTYIAEFPETLITMVAVVLEGCMGLGLIPTNRNYGKLFGGFSISAQITDQSGTPVYSSSTASPLTPEQFSEQSGVRIDEHTVLNKMKIPGGYGFWQDDMTELDRLNVELAETKEALAQEAELIRLRGELKEKRAKIEQRTRVYDVIARRTQRQSQMMSRLAGEARLTDDAALKDENRRIITLLGAYIKRYANLTLLSQESDFIEAGELALSISEVLRYLNYCGIPGEFFGGADRVVPAGAALSSFEAFGELIEANYRRLRGVIANLSAAENVTLKLTAEGLTEPLSDETGKMLSSAAVLLETEVEDGVAYVCFTLTEGGDAV